MSAQYYRPSTFPRLFCTGEATATRRSRTLPGRTHTGLKVVELEGEDHIWWVGDSESLVNEIQEFLTGERQAMEPDRVLATVLFTDIVDLTGRAAAMGDRHWRDLLDGHNDVAHKEITRFQGRAVKSTWRRFLGDFRRAGSCDPVRLCNQQRRSTVGDRNTSRVAHWRDRANWRGRRGDSRSYCFAGHGQRQGQRSLGLRNGQGPRRRIEVQVRRPWELHSEGYPRGLAVIHR